MHANVIPSFVYFDCTSISYQVQFFDTSLMNLQLLCVSSLQRAMSCVFVILSLRDLQRITDELVFWSRQSLRLELLGGTLVPSEHFISDE